MSLAMTRPTRRDDSASYQFKKRTPKALLAARRGEEISFHLPDPRGSETLIVTTKVGDVIKFSLRTRDDGLAKLRCAAVNAQIEQLNSAIVGGPRALTPKERAALAGIAYRAFADTCEDDPGSADLWARVQEDNRAAMSGPTPGLSIAASEEERSQIERSVALEHRFGKFVDATLHRECVITDEASRASLLMDFGRALTEAAAKLERNANGDYAPDPVAARFPKLTGATHPARLSVTALLEGWTAEAERIGKSPNTVDAYSRVLRMFIAFLGHDDAARVTREDVIRYKTKRLVDDGKSPKTVQDADLPAIKAVFAWGVANKPSILNANPSEGVSLKVPKGKKRKGYSDEGALKILRAALTYERSSDETGLVAAAKRWVPWVCAFTGARVGEIVQLRKGDVRRHGETWSIWVTPDAGQVKDKEEREIPLHPQLVEIGFVEFVQSAPEGYLFIAAVDRAEWLRTVKSTKTRLGEFARELVVEERVPAMHGWRHRFVSLCRRHAVDVELRRKITGHASQGVDEESYGDVEGLYREICKLPRYDI